MENTALVDALWIVALSLAAFLVIGAVALKRASVAGDRPKSGRKRRPF